MTQGDVGRDDQLRASIKSTDDWGAVQGRYDTEALSLTWRMYYERKGLWRW